MGDSIETVVAVEEFYVEILWLQEAVKKAMWNLKYLENPEYWWGYMTWYLDFLIWEWVVVAMATRNAKLAIQMLRKTKWYIALDQFLARINVAGEIAKLTFKSVNLDKLQKLSDEFWVPYGARAEEILKRSYVLSSQYWIDEEKLLHLINWEWYSDWRLAWWLHSMTKVEELLYDGKINIKYIISDSIKPNWEPNRIYSQELDYHEYILLSDKQKQKIRISAIWWWNYSNLKSLFSSYFSDEDIAILIKVANDRIENILINKYNLPLKSTPWADWRSVINWDIVENFVINWMNVAVRLWWKYDEYWNIDYVIYTLFPN